MTVVATGDAALNRRQPGIGLSVIGSNSPGMETGESSCAFTRWEDGRKLEQNLQ